MMQDLEVRKRKNISEGLEVRKRKDLNKESSENNSVLDSLINFGVNVAKEPVRIATDIAGLPGQLLQPTEPETPEESYFNRFTRNIPTGEQIRSSISPQLSPETQKTFSQQLGINPQKFMPNFNMNPQEQQFHQYASLLPAVLGFGLNPASLLKGAIATGAGLTSSGALSQAGSYLDELLGTGRKFFETAGGLAGFPLGHKGARTALANIENLPTKVLPKMQEEVLAEQRGQVAKEMSAKKAALAKEQLNAQKVLQKRQEAVPKKEAGLKKSSEKFYKSFDEQLEKLPKKDLLFNADNLMRKIDKISEDRSAGALDVDQNNIFKLAGTIDAKVKEGKFSFKDARIIRENLDDIIYERSASKALKKAAGKMRQELSDAMSDAVKPFPKLRESWSKSNRDWAKFRESEKLAPERNKAFQQEAKALEKGFGDKFNVLKKSEAEQNKLIKELPIPERNVYKSLFEHGRNGTYITFILNSLGFGGKVKAGATILASAFKELGLQQSLLNDFKKNNPAVWEKHQAAVNALKKGDTRPIIAIAPSIDAALKKYKEEEEGD